MNNIQLKPEAIQTEEVDLIFLGTVQEETKGFDFEGTYEPRNMDKYDGDAIIP